MPRIPAVEAPSAFMIADVARLLHDDHREDRQDAEPGHGDDEEQQDVQDALLDGDGPEQRPLLLLPGRDAEERRPQLVQGELELLGQPVDVRRPA